MDVFINNKKHFLFRLFKIKCFQVTINEFEVKHYDHQLLLD